MSEKEKTPGFMKASDYTPDELTLMQVNFQSFFQWTLDLAKANAPENQGISVKASNPLFSAEITYTPPATRYTRRSQQPPKPLNLVGAQGVVAEYPNLLIPPEDAGTFWFIGTKRKLDDKYQEIAQKLSANGFRYERWDQSKPHTGGWRANK